MSAWITAVGALPALSLVEVDARAALQTRVDRKYLVRPHTWEAVLGSLRQQPHVLEIDGRRSLGYSSTYYDTAGLESYRDAARRRPHRYKVRTRRYLDTGACAVEVKTRSAAGATSKRREWLDDDSPTGGGHLPPAAVSFVGGLLRTRHSAHGLTEVLTTTYDRVTLVTTDARVTVDREVAAHGAGGRRLDYPCLLVVETKSAGGPGVVDRALWARAVRPARFSKYCTSLAALHPELPSNAWSRTLRRHLPTVSAASARPARKA